MCYYYISRGLFMKGEKSIVCLILFTLIIPLHIGFDLTIQSEIEKEPLTLNTIETGKAVMRTNEGYNWWSYIPKSLQKNDVGYILVEESHGGSEDYEQDSDDALYNIYNHVSKSEQYGFILVTVVLPRDFASNYYPQGINYNSLRSTTPDFYYRPDLKVNNILSAFMANLTSAGYNICEKILVAGFSAGGMWANRYTLLHPEHVKAAAMGQAGGWLAMPISEYNSTTLNWPMGINDFISLTGAAYSKENILKDVPQFIFIGDQDNSATFCNEPWPTESEIQTWGMSDPERLENQCIYLINEGYNVTFTLYSGVAHDYTARMKSDIAEFFNSTISIDTDCDGLTDDEEIYLYGTDPNESDTDEDGFSDFDEINFGSDPNDSEDYPETDSTGTPGLTFLIASIGFVGVTKYIMLFTNKRRKRKIN